MALGTAGSRQHLVPQGGTQWYLRAEHTSLQGGTQWYLRVDHNGSLGQNTMVARGGTHWYLMQSSMVPQGKTQWYLRAEQWYLRANTMVCQAISGTYPCFLRSVVIVQESALHNEQPRLQSLSVGRVCDEVCCCVTGKRNFRYHHARCYLLQTDDNCFDGIVAADTLTDRLEINAA